MAFTVLT